MGRGSAGSAEVCNSAACATLLRWLKTELVEDEGMGGGKEEPAEAGKFRKRNREKTAKKKKEKYDMSLRILGMALMALMAPQEAQEEPVMAQEALAWGLLWWLQLEKAKAAKKKPAARSESLRKA